MKSSRNEKGSILIFATLMIVILLIVVGMGLDIGWLTYNRAQGQPAVDAAALTGASGIPTGNDAEIKTRIEQLQLTAGTNDYVQSSNNLIDGTVNGANVTLIDYNPVTQTITYVPSLAAGANGVRVGLEQTNPYTNSSSKTAINTPTFLTPLLNLLGANVSGTQNLNVTAVAALKALPSFPVVITGCPGVNPSTNAWCNPWVDGNGDTQPPLCSSCSGNTGTNCQLLRHPSPNDHSGWTNLQKDPPVSTDVVKTLIENTKSCDKTNTFSGKGQNICLNNGNIPTLVNTVNDLFGADGWDSNDCFLIPFVKETLSNITQCHELQDWAQICITSVELPGKGGGSPTHRIWGNISCPMPDLFHAKSQCYKPVLVRDTKSGM